MNKLYISLTTGFRWLFGRVGVIYIVLFIFSLTCVDLKMLQTRIKIRNLNNSIPDFSPMIISSKHQNMDNSIDWAGYKRYFELILRYMPDDVITKQLLGFVDFHMAQEQAAISLFKKSSVINGHDFLWSNYDLGVIYYKKGMWPQAADYLLKAVSSNPQLTVLLMQDCIVYRQIFNSPYFKYSLADEIYDAQAKAYILLLSSLYSMKAYDKMIVISDLAIANQHIPYKDAYYYYEGLAFFRTGQLEKAFLLFQKSITIEKNNPDVYYYIADIYHQAGQLELARQFLQASYVLHNKNDPRFPYDARVGLRFF